jgi:hypothetical protein
MSKNTDKRTATQRIEDLERAVMSLYNTADNMARDLMTIKDAIKLLGNKSDATIKAINRGGEVNDEVVGNIMVENNIEELKEKVATLVTQGILTASDEVNESSFIVGRDVAQDGKVINPRIQFSFGGADLPAETKEKLKGAKVGDVVDFGPEKAKFEVQEVYRIGAPEAPAEESVAASEESAPEVVSSEAPQADTSSEASSS